MGLVAFFGERPLGSDIIGGRDLYARLHERLLRGYSMDARETPDALGRADAAAAQRFLNSFREATRVKSPAVGRGRYSVLVGEAIGGELRDGERVAHLCAFPVLEGERGPAAVPAADPIAPPGRRRRR